MVLVVSGHPSTRILFGHVYIRLVGRHEPRTQPALKARLAFLLPFAVVSEERQGFWRQSVGGSVPAISIPRRPGGRAVLGDLQNAVDHQPFEQLARKLVADAERS